MRQLVLIQHGKASRAFEIREAPLPVPAPGEVLIRTEASGLNYADVMARLGLYRDAPPLPSVLGYDVCGRVESVGEGVTTLSPGQRVVAMTRFGGYAEYVCANALATAVISEDMEPERATALATQYCTAWHAACEMVNLKPGDRVLVSAAAGGVGTALVQIAHNSGCEVFAMVGSDAKANLVKSLGASVVINYKKENPWQEIRRNGGKGPDVVFDSLGGSFVKNGIKELNKGGKMVCFGGAQMAAASNIFAKIQYGLSFGFYHPAQLMMQSKALIGVNMLRIADHRPEAIQRALSAVISDVTAGHLRPVEGTLYSVEDAAKAHEFLESGNSTGKIAFSWVK